jgi:predicted esterase
MPAEELWTPPLIPLSPTAFYSTPPSPGGSVVIYLHGMYSPAGEVEERAQQRMVAQEAANYGLAVLFPRGRQGTCDWSPELADWYCWPSKRDQTQRGEEVASELTRLLDDVRGRLPRATDRPYVMGFSNGGFFAAMIASHKMMEARGFAILHGGPSDDTAFDAATPTPCLLITAEEDEWQRPKMIALADRLRGAGWKSELRSRPGAHRLAPQDVAAAMQFFAALGSGPLAARSR